MTMADTVAVMNAGRIEQMGSPADLYELPRTAFVANFLGQSNLLRGTVVEHSASTLGVDVAGRRLRVPTARAVSTTGDVLLGVRSEKLHILRNGEEAPDDTNIIGPGRVTDVSFTGVSTQYQVEIPGLGTMGVFVQNLLGGATTSLGEEVRLACAIKHTFALDGADDATSGAVGLDEHGL